MTHTFTAKEVMVPFKCDVHGWMNAYVGVLDHPYFAVTDDDGKFELKDAAAGHLHDRSVAREARRADAERDARPRRKRRTSPSRSRRRRDGDELGTTGRAAGQDGQARPSAPSCPSGLSRPSCPEHASPFRQVRRRLHRPPDPRGQPRHQHRSGLSVPDWPTTYGWNMFTFPPSMWVGGHLLRARPSADREHASGS